MSSGLPKTLSNLLDILSSDRFYFLACAQIPGSVSHGPGMQGSQIRLTRSGEFGSP